MAPTIGPAKMLHVCEEESEQKLREKCENDARKVPRGCRDKGGVGGR